MSQDRNLYGQPPAKKQKKEVVLSSSLAFTSQLQSLLATDTSSPASAPSSTVRPKPSSSSSSFPSSLVSAKQPKPKPDLFSTSKKSKRKVDSSAAADGGTNNSKSDKTKTESKLVLKSPTGTEDEKAERARARRKLEAKARLYAAMKRGDYVAREGEATPLVDFDRKWAEEHDDRPSDYSSSSADDSDSDDDNDGGACTPMIDPAQLVDHEDEFGRVRRIPLREKQRLDRRAARGRVAAAELAHLAARPTAAPEGLIVGDAVQTAAFEAREGASAEAMAALAQKRDRSATPPPAEHYDASKEGMRARGVGFYAFSKDEEERRREMEGLKAERENTERARREREEERARRKVEAAGRRKELGERRAKLMADSFLDDMQKYIKGEKKE